jgi:hypothetical protein
MTCGRHIETSSYDDESSTMYPTRATWSVKVGISCLIDLTEMGSIDIPVNGLESKSERCFKPFRFKQVIVVFRLIKRPSKLLPRLAVLHFNTSANSVIESVMALLVFGS